MCNPQSPVGAPGYYTSTIVGMASYCAGFAKVKPAVAAVDHYAATAPLPGVSASGPLTLVLKLIAPAPDFLNILAMGFASARPVEYLKYLPDSPQLRANTISDGPYQITNYSAGKSFTLVRNPAWKAATDPLAQGLRQQDHHYRGPDRRQRPAADPGRDRRHGVGRSAAAPGPSRPDQRPRQPADHRAGR